MATKLWSETSAIFLDLVQNFAKKKKLQLCKLQAVVVLA